MEVAKGLPDDLLELALEIDWRAVKGLRDVLGYEYFRIVSKIVHATVRRRDERELLDLGTASRRSGWCQR